MPRLDEEAIRSALEGLPGWTLTGAGISRRFDLPTYPDAVAAVVRVGFEAETAGHHPDVSMSWKRVTFTLTTHDEGGVTEKDVSLARTIDALLGSR